jgi:hypothetical protein
MKKNISIIVFLILMATQIISCCFTNPAGIYVAHRNKYFSDTLWVLNDNTFHQKITARNGVIVWDYIGEWKQNLSGIEFTGLVIDSDSLYYYEDSSLTGDDYRMSLWRKYADDYSEIESLTGGIDSTFYAFALQWNGILHLIKNKNRKRIVYRLFVDLPEREDQSWDEIEQKDIFK